MKSQRATGRAHGPPAWAEASARQRSAARAWWLRSKTESSWRSWACKSPASAPVRAAAAARENSWRVLEALDNKRYKAHTLGSAHLAGVQMRRFHSSILGRGRKGLLPGLRKGLLPLWGRDGQVKCSRASRQGGQEDVCRPAEPGVLHPVAVAARGLVSQPLLGGRRGRPRKPEGRAARCAAECAPHQQHRCLHVRRTCPRPRTFGAPRVGRGVRHPQAPSKLHHKRSALHASTPSRDGGKPRTRALLSLGTQESVGCDRRHRQVPVPTGSVGEGGKRLLLHAQGEVSGERLLEACAEGSGGKADDRLRGKPVRRIPLVKLPACRSTSPNGGKVGGRCVPHYSPSPECASPRAACSHCRSVR